MVVVKIKGGVYSWQNAMYAARVLFSEIRCLTHIEEATELISPTLNV